MRTLGFMPLLRSGDEVTTAVALHREMFTSFESSSKELYGKIKSSPDVLGSRIGDLSNRLFGSFGSPRKVLEQHTLFGAYSSVMAPSAADTLARHLISGEANRHRWAFRGHRKRKIPLLSSSIFRICPHCMDEDIASQGFAAWHVLHQLPSIGHCANHGAALHDDLSTQGRHGARKWPSGLPTMKCLGKPTDMASRLFMSDGYAAHLKLWEEAFEGNLIGIKPDVWTLVMDAVVIHYGTVDQACTQIVHAIESSWHVPIEELALRLHLPDGASFVRGELEQKIHASYVASRLVICGALDVLKLSPSRKDTSPWHFPIPLSSPRPYGSWISTATQETLRRCVFDQNFPPALCRSLAEDMDIYSVANASGIDRIILRSFVRTLHDDLLYTMSKEQSWDRSSWLTKELDRRELAWSSQA